MMRFLVISLVMALGLAPAAIAAAPTDPGPRLSDEQFFALLDLARPDLAEIRGGVFRRFD